ncbi:hypothetical protein FRC07_014619, partial [Ceratobasidium sp. 392]
MPLSAYIARRVRWIRVRKAMVLAATLLEPLTEGLVAGLLAAWSVRYLGFPIPWFIFMILHFAAWLIVDLQVYSVLATHHIPSDQLLSFCVAWALREVLTFPIWLRAVVGSEVEWRGTKYQMRKNGEVDRVDLDLLDKPRWKRVPDSAAATAASSVTGGDIPTPRTVEQMQPDPKWIPLESNPEASVQCGLTTAVHGFSDVYGLDPELLAMVPSPSKAILLVFPITDATEQKRKEDDARLAKEKQPDVDPTLIYIKQT